MNLDSLIPIFGILLVMIPVAGLTLALTLRLAVKPFVETLADALRDSRPLPDSQPVGGQLEELGHRLDELSYELRALRADAAVAPALLAGEPREAGRET